MQRLERELKKRKSERSLANCLWTPHELAENTARGSWLGTSANPLSPRRQENEPAPSPEGARINEDSASATPRTGRAECADRPRTNEGASNANAQQTSAQLGSSASSGEILQESAHCPHFTSATLGAMPPPPSAPPTHTPDYFPALRETF